MTAVESAEEARAEGGRAGGMARPGAATLVGVGIWILGVLLAPATSAELQRVEAVGSYGIREKLRSQVIPRDEAIQNALWEAVSRVAQDVIAERPPPRGPGEGAGLVLEGEGWEDRSVPEDGTGAEAEPAGDASASLRTALGDDMLPYTRSFQIQDDLGEQAAMFPDEPAIDSEYVVVVEVLVDVARVAQALERAGLVASVGGDDTAEIVVELLGLRHYEAFERVRAALRGRAGTRDVRPLEFSEARQVLLVVGPFEPRELATWLSHLEDDRLVLEPAGIEGGGRRIRMVGSWLPAAPEAAGEGPGASIGDPRGGL